MVPATSYVNATISWFCVVNVISGANRIKCELKRVKLQSNLAFKDGARSSKLEVFGICLINDSTFEVL